MSRYILNVEMVKVQLIVCDRRRKKVVTHIAVADNKVLNAKV